MRTRTGVERSSLAPPATGDQPEDADEPGSGNQKPSPNAKAARTFVLGFLISKDFSRNVCCLSTV